MKMKVVKEYRKRGYGGRWLVMVEMEDGTHMSKDKYERLSAESRFHAWKDAHPVGTAVRYHAPCTPGTSAGVITGYQGGMVLVGGYRIGWEEIQEI